jgi:hypothetical protein
MTLAQDIINSKYPFSSYQRREIRKINISSGNLRKELLLGSNEKLEGELDLTDFTNLEHLDCSNNNITKLAINSSVLYHLDCSQNNLSDLNSIKGDYNRFIFLRISNNNLFNPAGCNLSIFQKFVNLEVLEIGNSSQVSQNKYNFFSGSLQPLVNLTKLKFLDIQSTDIDSGLEYLPLSLNTIICYNDKRPTAAVSIIKEALEPFNFQIDKWRMTYGLQEFSNQTVPLSELESAQATIRKLEERVNLQADVLKGLPKIIELTEYEEKTTQTENNIFTQKITEEKTEENLVKEVQEKFGSLSTALETLLDLKKISETTDQSEEIAQIQVLPHSSHNN